MRIQSEAWEGWWKVAGISILRGLGLSSYQASFPWPNAKRGSTSVEKVLAPPTNLDFVVSHEHWVPRLPMQYIKLQQLQSLELCLVECRRRRRPGYWLEITMLRYLVPRPPQVDIKLQQLQSLPVTRSLWKVDDDDDDDSDDFDFAMLLSARTTSSQYHPAFYKKGRENWKSGRSFFHTK